MSEKAASVNWKLAGEISAIVPSGWPSSLKPTQRVTRWLGSVDEPRSADQVALPE